jgi:hypothetical protein
MPGRSSFQLPPALPPDLQPTDIPGFDDAPPEIRPGAGGWADEPAAPRGGVGAVGLVALALTVMIAVYFGATFLMNK